MCLEWIDSGQGSPAHELARWAPHPHREVLVVRVSCGGGGWNGTATKRLSRTVHQFKESRTQAGGRKGFD